MDLAAQETKFLQERHYWIKVEGEPNYVLGQFLNSVFYDEINDKIYKVYEIKDYILLPK